jgi:hypothetical protein
VARCIRKTLIFCMGRNLVKKRGKRSKCSDIVQDRVGKRREARRHLTFPLTAGMCLHEIKGGISVRNTIEGNGLAQELSLLPTALSLSSSCGSVQGPWNFLSPLAFFTSYFFGSLCERPMSSQFLWCSLSHGRGGGPSELTSARF